MRLQDTKDTTRLYVLIQLCWYQLGDDSQKSVKYGIEAVKLAKKMQYATGEGMALNNLGIAYMRREEYVKAIDTYTKAFAIHDSLGAMDKKAKTLANLGALYEEIGDYQRAMDMQQRAFVLKQELGDSTGMIGKLINLGRESEKSNNDKIAIDYYLKALEMSKSIGTKHLEAIIYNHIGVLEKNRERPQKALTYYNRAITIADSLQDRRTAANVLNNLGVVYMRQGNYKKALLHLKRSDSLYQTIHLPNLNVKLNMAESYLDIGHLDKAFEIAPKPEEVEYTQQEKADIFQLLSNIYEAKGMEKEAFAYQKQFSEMQKQIYETEQVKQIALMQAKFDLDLKEQQISSQKEQISVMEQKERADNNLRFALIALALLLLLLLGVAVNRYRIKQRSAYTLARKNEIIGKKNKEIAAANKELEKRMLRAQMDPHFIFNSLNSIQHFIMKNDKSSAMNYLSKFSKLIRQMLENSINVSVPIVDEIRLLEIYLELESLRFTHSFAYDIQVDESLDIYNTEIPFLLIQPYVENAIAHGLMHKRTKETEHSTTWLETTMYIVVLRMMALVVKLPMKSTQKKVLYTNQEPCR